VLEPGLEINECSLMAPAIIEGRESLQQFEQHQRPHPAILFDPKAFQ